MAPEVVEALAAELKASSGGDTSVDQMLARLLRAQGRDPVTGEKVEEPARERPGRERSETDKTQSKGTKRPPRPDPKPNTDEGLPDTVTMPIPAYVPTDSPGPDNPEAFRQRAERLWNAWGSSGRSDEVVVPKEEVMWFPTVNDAYQACFFAGRGEAAITSPKGFRAIMTMFCNPDVTTFESGPARERVNNFFYQLAGRMDWKDGPRKALGAFTYGPNKTIIYNPEGAKPRPIVKPNFNALFDALRYFAWFIVLATRVPTQVPLQVREALTTPGQPLYNKSLAQLCQAFFGVYSSLPDTGDDLIVPYNSDGKLANILADPTARYTFGGAFAVDSVAAMTDVVIRGGAIARPNRINYYMRRIADRGN